MINPGQSLGRDWDEDNINHIAVCGIRPEQMEEIYYSEGFTHGKEQNEKALFDHRWVLM